MRSITDLTINQSGPVSAEPGHRARVGEEIADVLLYLLRLADELGIDVMAAARAKQAAARERFPADGFRGVAPEKA